MLEELFAFWFVILSLAAFFTMAVFNGRYILKNTKSKSGRNEQRKLAATSLNTLAIALVLAGFATPFLSNDLKFSFFGLTAFKATIVFIFGFYLHSAARSTLADLED